MSRRPTPPSSEPLADPEPAWGQRASLPQLTARAVATGAVIGAVTGVSNLYVGLKIGWSMGAVLTASVLGWTAWQAARRVGLSRTPPSILEAAMMASTASGAGYSTGTTLVSAISAWLMLTGHHLPLWQMTLWILCVSGLGLFVAMGLRHRLIVLEALPFPTGAATAEMLQSLAAHDAAASRRAGTLLKALGVGLLVKWLTGVMPLVLVAIDGPSWLALPATLPTPGWAHAVPVLATVASYGFSLEVSVLLPAAGVLAGWRVAASMLAGALVCFGGLAPRLAADGIVPGVGYEAMISWSVWPGATLMTVAGLLSFVLHRRSPRAVPEARSPSPPSVPWRVLAVGGGVTGLGCVLLQTWVLGIGLGMALAAVAFAVALAAVAARITGETDVTPTGPLGKITQLTFGVVAPGRPVSNLMVAGVTAGVAASAADLLTDLKAGHRLGADPRQQLIAQGCGVVVGALVVVPVFRYVLVPDHTILGGAQWPAPAARVWVSVAQWVSEGSAALPPDAMLSIGTAAAVAVVLSLLQRFVPASRRWLPSATGLGLAFVLPPSKTLAFFVGGAIAGWLSTRAPSSTAARAIPVAAGLIAGESLMGVCEALLAARV